MSVNERNAGRACARHAGPDQLESDNQRFFATEPLLVDRLFLQTSSTNFDDLLVIVVRLEGIEVMR